MTNYHAKLDRFQPSALNPLTTFQAWLADCKASTLHWLIERHTRKVLEGLDRGMLEDIGVPHENPSPCAGELNRYPEIIRPRGLDEI